MPHLRSFFLSTVVFVSVTGFPLWGGASTLPVNWKGKWITPPAIDVRAQGVYYFRKTFRLGAVPQRAVVRCSADNRFVLYVNGARVAEGPARSDLDHWRFESVDLAPWLRPGENVLSAMVWNCGPLCPVFQQTDQTAFLIEAEGALSGVASDVSWEAKREAGRDFIPVDPRDVPGYYASVPGERIDASRCDWNWQDSTQGWSRAVEVGRGQQGRYPDPIGTGQGTGINRWILEPDPLPPMERSPTDSGRIVRIEGVNAPHAWPVAIPAHATVRLLVDRGSMTTGFASLTTSGGREARISVTYAEALVDAKGEKGDRSAIEGRHIQGLTDLYLVDGAKGRIWTTLAWRSWRFLEVAVTTGAEPLTVDGLMVEFTGFPFVTLGRFESDDPSLARIWEVGTRTARMNAHETYSDCPYWEQLQYVGDTRLQALISYVTFGDDRLAVQAIDAIDHSRSPEGITQSRYPAALPQYIPPFSLLWVGMIHDYWMYRPDPEGHLRDWVPHTRSVLDWFLARVKANGLLGRVPWWDFEDWTGDFKSGVPPEDADGDSALISLGLVQALRDAADLEDAFGDPARASDYRRRAAVTAAAVYRLCWDSRRGLLADTPSLRHFSEQTNARGVMLDVVSVAEQARVVRMLLDHGRSEHVDPPEGEFSPASLYFLYYVTRAMDHAGLGDQYLATLDPWRNMLARGLSTFAETEDPTRSDDHAWSAHPNVDLAGLVAGIRPGSPGFGTVRVEPHPGKLRRFDAVVPHPAGPIEVRYLQDGGRGTFEVTLPPALRGTFVWKGVPTALQPGLNRLVAK
jgi:alpha-L-rhamnosidase